MPEESKRYFTREGAERLIPRLQALMGRIKECHAVTGQLRGALQEAQRQVMLSGGARLDPEFWRSRKTELARVTAELQERIGEILKMGAVPKDLELGLVDFPALIDEREVNLCWRLGEERIRFWHGLDEGYAGRKPLPSEG
ncbi:MAG TPA: DUF2203 domain-containing protein [Methylomirabilota bacterium]|jgi:hypothetical protein|nr:DUF2203 domain-containing protein [Methylomirabilota bacterium]